MEVVTLSLSPALYVTKGATKMQKRPVDQKRADYYLYTWQIRAVQKISRDTHQPPSEVMRTLLNEALTRHEMESMPTS